MAFRSNLSRLLRLVLCAVVVLAAAGAQRLHAQAVGATLAGTVTDASGSVVPKASVAITNTGTGETRTVDTNADGLYSAPNLQPGNYSVAVSASGFSKSVQNGVVLTVGGSQTLNFSMQVGQTSQTVEVTAEAPTVNLTNAEIGAITDEAQIKELPLNGRSWSDLANLQPGVYQLHTQPSIVSRDRFTRGYGLQMSISGSRPQQNNYRVDGVSINDPGNGGPGSVLGTNAGVDAIAEFSVLTTGYSTEYGRASGGIINATTKSGTNQFHGTAYEFLRNSAMDASNYWDAKDTNGNYLKPQFRRNQFGASAGGPIIKDKTFVFGDYEGLRQGKGLSNASPIPSLSYINGVAGDMSQPAHAVNVNVQPYLNAFFPLNGSLNGKTVCQIQSGGVGLHTTDFCVFGANQVSSEDYYIIRADHNISRNDMLSGTFYRDKASTNTPDEYNNKIVSTATSSTFATIAETHTFGSNIVNSARFGFHRDFQGGPAGAVGLNPATSNAALGAFGGLDAPQVFVGGNALFTGGLTSDNPQKNSWNTFQFYDDAFMTKGKHSLKFGFAVERDQLNVIRSPRPGGIFQFSSMADFLANCGAVATPSCPSLAGDLAQAGSGNQKISTDLPGLTRPSEPRQSIFGAYFQDDWKIRQNLTINLGLRYEPTTVPTDPQGRDATLPSIYDATGNQLPMCGSKFAAIGPTTCTAQTNGLFKNNSLRDFDPRVGFAWDPQSNGKMSVRGGFGFYDQLPLLAFLGSTSNSQTYPFLLAGSSGNLASGSFGPAASFTSPCPAPPPPGTPYPSGTAMSCQVSAGGVKGSRSAFIDQNPKRAYVMQWNLSVERQIIPNLTLMVGYVGSHGVHGTTQVDDANIVLPTGSFATGYLWPCGALPVGGNINDCAGHGSGITLNQTVGRLPATFFRNSSVYHGLEVQLTKQMARGFQVTGSFTYQKSLDTASGAVISDSVITAISSLNWFDPRLTRGPSDFNNPKTVSINGLWNIPTPKTWTGIADKAVGGWQIGGIFSASAGQPFSAILAGDALGLNNSDSFAYPNRLASCGNNLTNPGNINNYVKLQCFQIPAPVSVGGTNFIPLGNSGRNIMEGPGLVNMDLSLEKNTKIARISDSFALKFRLDVFNIANRANFNPPVQNEFLFDPTTLASGTTAAPGPTGACTGSNFLASGCVPQAGALNGNDKTATESRQMQVSLKVIW
ncbi:MAG TPA: TonB-dependent receptor [Candidatus Acidoferrales bacterium]|nr:TonB-dependent receptor [Candidatus Acidoferrales bacterium]